MVVTHPPPCPPCDLTLLLATPAQFFAKARGICSSLSSQVQLWSWSHHGIQAGRRQKVIPLWWQRENVNLKLHVYDSCLYWRWWAGREKASILENNVYIQVLTSFKSLMFQACVNPAFSRLNDATAITGICPCYSVKPFLASQLSTLPSFPCDANSVWDRFNHLQNTALLSSVLDGGYKMRVEEPLAQAIPADQRKRAGGWLFRWETFLQWPHASGFSTLKQRVHSRGCVSAAVVYLTLGSISYF